MSASQSICANVLRNNTRRAAPVRAQRGVTVRAAATERTLPIDLRGTLRSLMRCDGHTTQLVDGYNPHARVAHGPRDYAAGFTALARSLAPRRRVFRAERGGVMVFFFFIFFYRGVFFLISQGDMDCWLVFSLSFFFIARAARRCSCVCWSAWKEPSIKSARHRASPTNVSSQKERGGIVSFPSSFPHESTPSSSPLLPPPLSFPLFHQCTFDSSNNQKPHKKTKSASCHLSSLLVGAPKKKTTKKVHSLTSLPESIPSFPLPLPPPPTRLVDVVLAQATPMQQIEAGAPHAKQAPC